MLDNIYARYGLDKPEWQQLVEYIYNVVFRLDFGPSFQYRDRTVQRDHRAGLPGDLHLWRLGVRLGELDRRVARHPAAVRQNSWLDYLAVGFTVGAQVVPNFVHGADPGAGVHAVDALAAGRRLEWRHIGAM